MEPDRKRVARRHTRGVEGNGQHATLTASSLSQIAELIQYGDITIGQLHQIGCVATASDEDRTLAMLVRRKGGKTVFMTLTNDFGESRDQ
jgi:hypothetical protein